MNELTMFAENIKSALKHEGLSGKEVATMSRISENEFELYSNGICFPDADTLGRIADSLHVRVKDLAGEEQIKYTSFGQELRAIREAEGLNRVELSELSGVPYKSIANYEMDKVRHVEVKNITKLEDVLGESFTAAVRKYGMRPVKVDKAPKAPKAKAVVPEAPKAKAVVPEAPVVADVAETPKVTTIERSWFDLLRFIDSDREFRKAVNALVYGKETPNAEQFPEAALVLRMIREGE